MSTEGLELAFAIANVVVGLGYLFVALAVAPHFVVRYYATKWGAVVFFLGSSLTHFEIARASFADELVVESPYHFVMLALQVIQAVAVWCFVVTLYYETRRGAKDATRPEDEA